MADKGLGQHWLKNRGILEEIAELAGTGEVCVEIGPGLGTLTSSLLRRFSKVIAVEFDAELARKLPGQFPGKDLEVVNADFLKFELPRERYVVAGNIPYYITSPIIRKVLEAEVSPERAVLLMQKEVAERVVAKGGKASVLSLWVENRAEASLGPIVRAEEFEPAPKVDSQVLVLKPHAPRYPEEMFKLIQRGFSSPRKKLIHNLPCREALERLRISTDVRPADLRLEDWRDIMELC